MATARADGRSRGEPDGQWARDAAANRFLRTCDIRETVPTSLARRAAAFRTKAGRGSAVDALVAATADPGGTLLTGAAAADFVALAANATDVAVEAL